MACPNCRAEEPEGAEECPACGVIFAKLRQRREREVRAAEAELLLAQARAESLKSGAPAGPGADWWKSKPALLAALGLWLIFAGGLAVRLLKRMRLSSEMTYSDSGPPKTVIVRDPKTGRLQELPVKGDPPPRSAARPADQLDNFSSSWTEPLP